MAILGLAVAACTSPTNPADIIGTPPSGPSDIGGLDGDLGFPVTSATEVHEVDEFGFTVGYGFSLSTLGLTCTQLEALDGGQPSMPYLEVIGGIGCATGCGPPAIGTYAVEVAGAADQEVAFLHVTGNPDAGADDGGDAATGSITFTYSTNGQIAGSFDVEVYAPATGSTSELQGTFNVDYCP